MAIKILPSNKKKRSLSNKSDLRHKIAGSIGVYFQFTAEENVQNVHFGARLVRGMQYDFRKKYY